MDEKNMEIDYQAITDAFYKKEDTIGISEDEKLKEDEKYWKTISKYQDSCARLRAYERTIKIVKNQLRGEMALSANLAKEAMLADQCVNDINTVCNTLERNFEIEKEALLSKRKVLYEKMSKLPETYTDSKPNIAEQRHRIAALKERIAAAKEKIQAMQTLGENDFLVPPALKELTKCLQQECIERYGDPNVIQRELQCVDAEIKQIETQINDTKMKYGV